MRDIFFKLGLRLKDVPEGIWAVVPYSFMIDRAIDISSSIRALTNLLDPSVRILAGWVVEHNESKTSSQLLTVTHSVYTYEIGADSQEQGSFAYTRTPWVPTVFDAIPEFDISGLVDDVTKVADLLALVYRNFRP